MTKVEDVWCRPEPNHNSAPLATQLLLLGLRLDRPAMPRVDGRRPAPRGRGPQPLALGLERRPAEPALLVGDEAGRVGAAAGRDAVAGAREPVPGVGGRAVQAQAFPAAVVAVRGRVAQVAPQRRLVQARDLLLAVRLVRQPAPARVEVGARHHGLGRRGVVESGWGRGGRVDGISGAGTGSRGAGDASSGVFPRGSDDIGPQARKVDHVVECPVDTAVHRCIHGGGARAGCGLHGPGLGTPAHDDGAHAGLGHHFNEQGACRCAQTVRQL